MVFSIVPSHLYLGEKRTKMIFIGFWYIEYYRWRLRHLYSISFEWKRVEIFIRTLPKDYPPDLFRVQSWVHLGHPQFEAVFEKAYVKLTVFSIRVTMFYIYFYLFACVETPMGPPLLFQLTKGNHSLEFNQN